MPEPELAQFGVSSLAIDSTNVYWTNYANPSRAADVRAVGGDARVRAGAADEHRRRLGEDPLDQRGSVQVMSCLLADDCKTPTVLADSQTGANGIAVDADNVYWTANGNGTVARCATTQGGPLAISLDATASTGPTTAAARR